MTKEAWRERPGVQVRIARQEKLEDPEVEYGRAGDVEEYYEPMEEKDQRAKNTLLLWEATEAGEGEKVSHLLSNAKGDGPDVHYKGPEEWTNLHTAVSEGHFYIAKLLLDNEALVDARTASMRTALHIACIRGERSWRIDVRVATTWKNLEKPGISRPSLPDLENTWNFENHPKNLENTWNLLNLKFQVFPGLMC